MDESQRKHLELLVTLLTDELFSLDLDGVPATSHPHVTVNVFREDTPTPSLTAAEALSGAPETENGYFKMPPMKEGTGNMIDIKLSRAQAVLLVQLLGGIEMDGIENAEQLKADIKHQVHKDAWSN